MAVTIKEVYARNGRVHVKKLTELVKSVNKITFCKMIAHPMIVSKQLYEVQLQQYGDSTNTMVLNVKDIREKITQKEINLEDTVSELSDGDNYNSSIFSLTKNIDSYNDLNTFTVGRVIPNDIVIPDFTISKQHASIKYIENSYQCFDLNSTNGTLVADKLLKANESITLRPCEHITFGRLGFVFMPPENVYDLLSR